MALPSPTRTRWKYLAEVQVLDRGNTPTILKTAVHHSQAERTPKTLRTPGSRP